MTGWTENDWNYRKRKYPDVFVAVSKKESGPRGGPPELLYDWATVQRLMQVKLKEEEEKFNFSKIDKQVATLDDKALQVATRRFITGLDSDQQTVVAFQAMAIAIQGIKRQSEKFRELSIENAELMKQLSYGNHQDYWTVRRVYETVNDPTGQEYDTHRLKEYSTQHGYSVITTKIGDHCRNGANAYHKDVWKAVYPELGWA